MNKNQSDYRGFIAKFLKIEDELSLLNWEISELPIWELVRWRLSEELFRKINKVGQLSTDKKSGNITKAMLKYPFNAILSNPLLQKKKTNILIFNHSRRKYNNSYYEDIYTDILLDELDENYTVVERMFQLDHFTPIRTKNLYYLDYIELPSRFINKLKRYKFTKHEIDLVNKIEHAFEKNFNVKFNGLMNVIDTAVIRNTFMYKYLQHLIQVINPKLFIFVNGYSPTTQLLNYICNKKSINTLELQHGIIGDLHLGYNFPPNSYIKTFPKYIALWGKYWSKNTMFPSSLKNSYFTGFPYFERHISNYKNIKSDGKTILIISQLREDLFNFTYELAQLLPNYSFIFKAHPEEYSSAKRKYQGIKDIKNMKLVDDGSVDLYELFAKSTFQIGVNSTALIEGLAFDLITIISKLPSYEYYLELINEKEFYLSSSATDAANFIINNSKNLIKRSSTYYWETDSKIKTLKLIHNLLRD